MMYDSNEARIHDEASTGERRRRFFAVTMRDKLLLFLNELFLFEGCRRKNIEKVAE